MKAKITVFKNAAGEILRVYDTNLTNSKSLSATVLSATQWYAEAHAVIGETRNKIFGCMNGLRPIDLT